MEVMKTSSQQIMHRCHCSEVGHPEEKENHWKGLNKVKCYIPEILN